MLTAPHPKVFMKFLNSSLCFILGLGYFSEQAFESMHHDAKVLWEKVKVGVDHPDVEKALQDFVISYNAKHM